jgi:hypothetical protein
MRWIYGLIGLAFLPGAALAQSGAIDPEEYGMFGISGEATWYNFRAANGLTLEIDDNPNFVRQAEDGFEFGDWGGGGTAHLVLPLPEGPFGIDVVHLVFGGGAASSDSDEVIQTGAGEVVGVLPIAGGPASAFFMTDTNSTASGDAEVDFRRFFGAPTVGWIGGNVTVKLGPLVEAKAYDLDADILTTTGAFAGARVRLDESVDVWSAGPMAAAMVNVPFNQHFGGFLGGQAAALYADGHLSGRQDFIRFNGLPGCSPQPNCPYTASDEASDLAFMGRAVAGLSATSGRLTGSIFGAAEWRNDMYEIVNPRAAPGQDVTTTNYQAAHLEQTDMWNLSVGLKASIKLGGGAQ